MANQTNQFNQIEFNDRSVLFSASAFDRAIVSHGVKMVHYRAMPCPVGKVDRYSVLRPDHDHSGCSNGQIYTKAGEVRVLFINSGNKMDQYDTGILEGTRATVTTPRTYDDNDDEIQVVPFDKFYMLEEQLVVPHTQLVETHISGKDRLAYPVVKVIDLMDARGKTYCHDDYEVVDGQIKWKDGGGPGYNLPASMGVIYSIRYLYRPYFYVDNVIQQTRYITVNTGLEVKNVRGPQEFILVRERVFEKQEKDPQAPNPDSQAQVKGPRAVPLGPR